LIVKQRHYGVRFRYAYSCTTFVPYFIRYKAAQFWLFRLLFTIYFSKSNYIMNTGLYQEPKVLSNISTTAANRDQHMRDPIKRSKVITLL
jgi:hypothetical protein